MSWVCSAGWDCCTLHSFVHYWWNNGGLSLIIVLMGPPPQCSGYIFGVIGVNCNLFFGIVYRPLCPVLGCAAPFGGGTIVGFGARTKRGVEERGNGIKGSLEEPRI